MRKLDFLLLSLIAVLSVWCSLLHLGLVKPSRFSSETEGGEAVSEERITELEESIQHLQDGQKAAEDRLNSLEEGLIRRQESRTGGERRREEGETTRSDERLKRLIDERIAEYFSEKEKEAAKEMEGVMKEVIGSLEEQQNEWLAEWVKGAVKALKLSPQDETVLLEILKRRNEKVSKMLAEKKAPITVFGKDELEKIKRIDGEMFDEVIRIYGNSVAEEFIDFYKKHPLPMLFSSVSKDGKKGFRMGVVAPPPPPPEDK